MDLAVPVSEPTPASSRPALMRASARAVAIGLLLIPLNAYWLVIIEVVRNTQTPTSISLFFNVIFTMLLVTALNAPLRRWAPSVALTPPELVTIYTLVSLGSALAGIDMTCCLLPVMAYPAHYATPENGWSDLVLPLLPKHLMVFDSGALDRFWTGSSSLHLPENYRPWIGPLLWWNGFIVLMCVAFLGLAAIFRRRWIETERLTYPIAQIPMEIAAAPHRLFTSRAFAIAFCLAAGIGLVNGLHVLKPIVPQIPVRSTAIPGFNLGAQLIDRPWNAMGFLAVSFYPFIIGLGLLIPTELTFSCWWFYLFFKLQAVLASQFGKLAANGPPYVREQSLGAYMGLLAFSLWMSRSHLLRVLRAVRPRDGARAGAEAMGYRTAVGLVALACGGLVWFGHRAGMSVGYSAAFFAIYLALSQALTRIRAEMGIPSHEMHFVGPGQILPRLLGTRGVGDRNTVVSYAFYWFNYGHRCHPMPHIAEGHKLASRVGLSPRSLAVPMLVAMVLGSVCACWGMLHAWYRDGAAAKWAPYHAAVWIASLPMNEIVAKLQSPTSFSTGTLVAVVTGFVMTVACMSGHSRVDAWPLHPIGYAVSTAWAMEHQWFSLFIAWAVKSLLIRYGGHSAVRRAVPFAMGLVIGDFVAGSLWSLYGTWKGFRAYSIWV